MTKRIRHRVVFLSFLTSVLLYLDRFVLSYTERLIRVDLGLTERQMAWGLSAFFWSYALAQVPSGLLTDRYGPRRMLTLYVLAWSAGTAMMGWMNGFAMLILVRLSIGLAQAGAYPTCAAIVGRWVPLKRRGLASSLVAIGGRIGGGIAPLLTALLVVWFSANEPPEIKSSDLMEPARIADQLAFAAEHSTLIGATEEKQTRLAILNRLTTRFTPEQRKAAAEIGEMNGRLSVDKPDVVWEARFGAAPGSPLATPPTDMLPDLEATSELWLRALNNSISGPLLATDADTEHLPIESEAELTIRERSQSEHDLRRANRLILQAALPGCIRPLYTAGWRPVMWTYGLAGIVVAALFWFVVRDWPAAHPRITTEELTEIEEGRTVPVGGASQSRPRLPLGTMVTSPSLWLISGSQFFGNVAWTFLVLQMPRYLQEAHHCSFAERSLYASIPLWCGWGGMILGGIGTDRCVRRFGLRLGRVIPLAGSRALATTAFVGMMFDPSLPMAIALLSIVSVATDFASPATWAFNQDVGGRFIASTLGWGNMWGNIGSAISPLILGFALTRTGSWAGPFTVCALSYSLAACCSLFIDPRKSIDTE
jgi:MFS transporter, ACS family, glucarate transporter